MYSNIEFGQCSNCRVEGDLAQLSPRERQVLHLAARYFTNEEIAAELGVQLPTVKTHVTHILSKLNVESRRETARIYWRSRG